MNELVAETLRAGDAPAAESEAAEPMRQIEPFVISPSEDVAVLAQRFTHRLPRVIRLALDGLGTPDAQSADLMSYLLFDTAFTRTLVDLGYHDAGERIDELEALIRNAPETPAAPERAAPRRARAAGFPRARPTARDGRAIRRIGGVDGDA
jgi:NTE family protein